MAESRVYQILTFPPVRPDDVRHDGLPLRRPVRARRAPRRNYHLLRGRALQAAARVLRQEEPGAQDPHRQQVSHLSGRILPEEAD